MLMILSELPDAIATPWGAPERNAIPPGHAPFREMVGQLGLAITAPMTSALERVNAFATTGRMDRAGLRGLREEIERVRRLGLIAQRICRFASGRVGQTQERLNLTRMLHDALAQRGRETEARGIVLRQQFQNAEVVADASMLSALLQALLDWSFEHARSHIEFSIAMNTWPVRAQLGCGFVYVPADELPAAAPDDHSGQSLETMPWHLLHCLARTLGLVMKRDDAGGATHLTLEFPRTAGEGVSTLPTLDFEDSPSIGPNSQPILGRHVLVIAGRRETRNTVRETLRPMGLMVDYVGTVEEAREFCGSGLPHAIVYEAALAGENFRRLRAEWSREVASLAFIEIGEQGRALEVFDLGGQRTVHVGRDVIVNALPNALMLELTKA
jgi:hypothetical protein